MCGYGLADGIIVGTGACGDCKPATERVGAEACGGVLATVLTAVELRFSSFFFFRFESVGSLHSQVAWRERGP